MKNVLITGGGGFVGKAIVKQLLKKGIKCTVIGRNDYPELSCLGINCIKGDICDLELMKKSFIGIDTVFHTAALAGIWGDKEDYFKVNFHGTDNVIKACEENNVKRLIYTSTPSVVFEGVDILNGKEDMPYAENFSCYYAESKAKAEKLVLESSKSTLKTCAIRPHLIWGPGDPHLVPRIIERAKAGRLRMVGDGLNLVDISYIDNVAQAHLLAAENLITRGTAEGQAYFISQEKPVNLWQWVNELLQRKNIPIVRQKISLSKARKVGQFLEFFYKLFKIKSEPKMTVFLAEQLGMSHYFSNAKARRDLGYIPDVSIEDGMDKMINAEN